MGRGHGRFCGFRHVVRNVYAYVLDPRRIGELMDVLPGTFAAARSQLADFDDVPPRYEPPAPRT